MTHEQLIAKAREHAAAFEHVVPSGPRVSDFERATVREAAVIRFESSHRDDHILIYLDAVSGEYISGEYAAGRETGTTGSP